jgi:hypothetical protein
MPVIGMGLKIDYKQNSIHNTTKKERLKKKKTNTHT